MKKYIKLIIVVMLFVAPLVLNATNLRGRIDGFNQYYQSYYPLSRIKVDLYYQNQSGWQQVGSYITGQDGMYYFPNIAYGYNYSIQINGRQNYPIIVYNLPSQDLAPILLSY